jgi:hypothetical protein
MSKNATVSFPCPVCGGKSGVKDSRPTGTGEVRRRRHCLACGARWTTSEVLKSTAFTNDFLHNLKGAIGAAEAGLRAVKDLLSQMGKPEDD